jgi:hypothetical protein
VNDDELKQSLKRAFESAEGAPPDFGTMLSTADAGLRRKRMLVRLASGVAAAAFALFVGLWSSDAPQPPDEYLIADALMNSTAWSAPSDVLMPEHQFDVYREISFPVPSTNSQEGSLL